MSQIVKEVTFISILKLPVSQGKAKEKTSHQA
jgi:hypothetical protein